MRSTILLIFSAIIFNAVTAQIAKAPLVKDGEGPWPQLIIRGVTLINSTGAPPIGPVDIVVENNRIVNVANVGAPGVSIDPKRRPQLKEGGKEIQAEGMYLLPGFIDMHGHIGGTEQGTPAEYVFKLWMAHGITTIREPGSGNGLEWVLDEKKLSAENKITAPRIYAYSFFGQGAKQPISTPEQAITWVRENQKKGADGVKFFGAAPQIMDAALRENKRLGLRSACHHAQMDVARWNVLNSARAGLTSMEHWYGLPEAMFDDKTIQNYSLNYNYANEADRFGEAGRLWKQAAPPFSDKWNKVMNELIALDFTLDPTFNIYDATRDLQRARRLEWHDNYTLPSLWKFYEPSRESHGSFWLHWGTEDEIAWKENYRLWMTFVNEYKNRGGRVTAGSDDGFIYETYGFGYIRELEMLREAGFHPLEVVRSATLYAAQALGAEKDLGSVEVGKLADMVIIDVNPLENLQVLYGTGTIKVTADNKVVRAGGIKYTIKDGIVYDAKKLLADVKKMVEVEKAKTGWKLKQPGEE
ncbi:amidohydrolase family protein [Ferruginibacter paludis]|uniref:amidohydrolase family protein n=1 Tax=Ferruginibacter paludis TaxID=1310417 RepID=UPI0025B573A7|nr:amidohydrolase family protein [Ferruginibacter paludis]MDN3657438.1 amidohydrolase family protein [Ferruginibacter paludis]